MRLADKSNEKSHFNIFTYHARAFIFTVLGATMFDGAILRGE